jgi:hypothetical protein
MVGMKKSMLMRLELRISVIIISSLLLNICSYFLTRDNNSWAQGVTQQLGQSITRNVANVSHQTPSTPHILPIIPYFMSPQPQSQTQNTMSLKSTGTVNSLIHTPKAQWIATGNWSMTVDNGSLRNFGTNMTWFNALGNASHTHEFRNLNPGGKIVIIHPDNSVSLKGLMDVGTNHRIVWKNVPATVDIHGGKTIIISLDDKATNHHFAGQPILGVVTSLIQCSDLPGPNMEVLPSCT